MSYGLLMTIGSVRWGDRGMALGAILPKFKLNETCCEIGQLGVDFGSLADLVERIEDVRVAYESGLECHRDLCQLRVNIELDAAQTLVLRSRAT